MRCQLRGPACVVACKQRNRAQRQACIACQDPALARHGWPGMAGAGQAARREAGSRASSRQQAGSRQAAGRQQQARRFEAGRGVRQEADTLAMTRDVSVSFGRVSRSHPPPRTRLTDSPRRKRSTSRSQHSRRQNGG